MTKEEALARYDRIRYNLLNPDDKAAVDVAFEALEEQETVTNRNGLNGWISVEDRLPEYGKNVLVCDIRENYVSVWSLDSDEDGACWSDNAGWWQPFREITHWMPLPEPPEVDAT